MEYIHYVKESKKKLKKSILIKKKLITKVKYMILGCICLPLIFDFIDNIHGTVSGE